MMSIPVLVLCKPREPADEELHHYRLLDWPGPLQTGQGQKAVAYKGRQDHCLALVATSPPRHVANLSSWADGTYVRSAALPW